MGIVDTSARPLSRRALGRVLAAAATARFCRAAGLSLDAAAGAPLQPPRLRLERAYRADAAVIFCGVQLLHRDDVGGGHVRWHEFDGAPGRLLEFAGYSLPPRCAGLNRLGFIREWGEPAAACSYFGLMTSSPEESAEEARRALHAHEKEQAYTAIQGLVRGGGGETAVARFNAPSTISGDPSSELIDRARAALSGAFVTAMADAGPVSGSFLQTLSQMLPRPDAAEGRYLYSGRAYRLHLTRAADARATSHFRQLGLLAGGAEAVRVSGRLWREEGGPRTEFRLWIPSGEPRPLPLRIEYQPKSYLRLVFEAVSA